AILTQYSHYARWYNLVQNRQTQKVVALGITHALVMRRAALIWRTPGWVGLLKP
ncbi:hypothetical protein FRC07_011435, partial [Ceratobasidium sp. 392]